MKGSEASARSNNQHELSLRIVLFVVMCVGFFIFHIWFRTVVVTEGYEVANLRRKVSVLESEIASLQVEGNRLKSPLHLEKVVRELEAKGEIFKSPSSEQLLYTTAKP